VAQAVL